MAFITFSLILIYLKLMTTVFSKCDMDCQDECLVFHNKYRMNHNVSLLTYDRQLAVQAQHWADHGKLDTSIWGKSGEGGECWAWGNIFPSWKAVVKTWHDQERNFDWENFKAKDDHKVGCFQQVVWAGATKLGCGVGEVDGLPFYVAQMDVAGVVDHSMLNHGHSNIKKPILPDLHWFSTSNAKDRPKHLGTSMKQF